MKVKTYKMKQIYYSCCGSFSIDRHNLIPDIISDMKYHIWTEGCQMNVADSQRVGSALERLGYQFFLSRAW